MLVLGEVSIPTQGVRLVQDQVVAYLNDAPIAGEGTLAVAESAVTWISRREGRGFSLSYPSIIMHAISTDVSSFPHEHVLVVADAGRAGSRAPRRPIPLFTEEEAAAAADVRVAQQELAAGGEGGEGEGDDEESEDGNLILRFVPSDLTALDTIYKEMAECQELNPEEEDMEEDEEEEEEGEEGAMNVFNATGDLGPGWYTADNLDAVELSEEGRANLERMMRNATRHNGGGDTNGHHEHDDEEEHGMEE